MGGRKEGMKQRRGKEGRQGGGVEGARWGREERK